MTNANQSLLIDLVADPVCPWCYVGLHSFKAAKEALGGGDAVTVRFRPYQLNPDTPLEGVDRKTYYERKFSDTARLEEMRAAMVQTAAAMGAPFDPSQPAWLPNTLMAHQLLQLAQHHGAGEKAAFALYNAYWIELEDIGQGDVLLKIGRDIGLDGDAVKSAFAETKQTVAAEADAFRRAGVSGVPTFIVNEKQGFSGAHPPETLVKALQHAAIAAPS